MQSKLCTTDLINAYEILCGSRYSSDVPLTAYSVKTRKHHFVPFLTLAQLA